MINRLLASLATKRFVAADIRCRQGKIMVATNLKNLEYSGISLNMENSGNSQGILCNLRGKLKQNILVRHSNICVKQLLTG